jgi:hypothetical protein
MFKYIYIYIYIGHVEDCVIDIRMLQERDRIRRKRRKNETNFANSYTNKARIY